jgi:hypothetical protein
MSNPLPDIEKETRRLISEAQGEGIQLRLLGGLAVKTHSPHAGILSLQREYPDIDFITDKAGGQKLSHFMLEMSYTPNKAFNIYSGDRRQLYFDEANGRQVDIFIGEFEMCHRLPLAERLHLEPVTIPLAELFLTKAQIVELNRKDVLDILALLLDHTVGEGDNETINANLIAQLCAKDWGLHTTVSMSIQKVHDVLFNDHIALDDSQKQIIRDRLTSIKRVIDEAPKSSAWKVRSKLGRRVRWYLEVEEVQR